MKLKIGLIWRILIAIGLAALLGSIAHSFYGSVLAERFVRTFATFNGIFGNFLQYAVPFIIIAFITPSIAMLGKGSGKLLALATGFAYCSTLIAGFFAYAVAVNALPSIIHGVSSGGITNPEEFLQKPFFKVEMPPFFDVMSALLFAFIVGIGLATMKSDTLKRGFEEFQVIIEKLIKSVIIPLLPFHIFGIFLNMTYGGQVVKILSIFGIVFLMIIAMHLIYLVAQYSVAGALHGRSPLKLLRTMAPAYLTAIGTQSSAASIPVTLAQARKTGASRRVVDFAIPLFATIHLSGSTITLVTCTLAVILMNGMAVSFATYAGFIALLGVMMVAAPGVPGGAVVAATGIMKTVLGFDDSMVALMIALYLAQDSFGTATNVTGDGSLAMMVDRFVKKRPEDQPLEDEPIA